jgi:hypothetical protein
MLAGEGILGPPDEDETNPYTHRGLVGGAAVGAGLGGLGAMFLASGGKLPMAKLGSFGSKVEKGAQEILGADNVIAKKLRAWARNPNASNLTKAGLVGSLAGGATGGGFAMGEGQEADVLSNELVAHKRRRLRRDSES